MPTFPLRLEKTYWLRGFFNVGVDFQRFVTATDGPFDLYLGDAVMPTSGRVSRRDNTNATPRIFGRKALAEFFQRHKQGDVVQVEIISPTAMRLTRGPSA